MIELNFLKEVFIIIFFKKIYKINKLQWNIIDKFSNRFFLIVNNIIRKIV